MVRLADLDEGRAMNTGIIAPHRAVLAQQRGGHAQGARGRDGPQRAARFLPLARRLGNRCTSNHIDGGAVMLFSAGFGHRRVLH